jgi:hypothetical protein
MIGDLTILLWVYLQIFFLKLFCGAAVWLPLN